MQRFHVVGKTDSLKENQKYKEIPIEFLWDYIMQQHGILCWKYASYLEQIGLKTFTQVYGHQIQIKIRTFWR